MSPRIALLLSLTACSLQIGEVAEVTARDHSRTSTRQTSSLRTKMIHTRCEAHVDYVVDGQTFRAHDMAELATPGQPAENCPFDVGQTAVVWVGSTPETTRVFTTSGRTWFLFGGLLLLPMLVVVRMLRARRSDAD